MNAHETIPSSYDDEPAEILAHKRISDDSVRDYLNEIGKTTLLTAEQEVELAKRIEAGVYAGHLLETLGEDEVREAELQWVADDGKEAKRHLIEANLRLVVSLAKRYQSREVPLIDLIQEGNLGLEHAVKKFDYTKGFKFSTYGTWWIRQAIARGKAESSYQVKLPVHKVETINKLNRITGNLRITLQREPSEEEVAKESNVSIETLREYREFEKTSQPVSIDTPLNDGDLSLGEAIASKASLAETDTEAMKGILYEKMIEILSVLNENEADVIMRRFGFITGEVESYTRIAKRHGISSSTVRNIEHKTIEMLRCEAEKLKLDDFLR